MDTEKINSTAPHEQPASTLNTPELSEQPALNQPAMEKHSRKLTYALAALLAVLLAGAGSYLYWFHSVEATQHIVSNPSNTQKAVMHPAPAVERATIGGLQAAYLTLPLTADQAATDPINGPAQMITTASGHYLLRDLRGSSYAHSNKGGKLLYDGKAIYSGPYLWTFALSQNGEHYLYMLDTTTPASSGNIEVYADGKLVQTFAENKWLYYPQISNDGKHYAYVTGALGTDVVKDGKTIFTNSYVETAFNADLTKYIAATQRNTDHFDVIVNGAQVASHVTFMANNALFAISNNGRHYIYRGGNILYEDGKEIATNKSIDATAVTDNGAYAIADLVSNTVNISGKSYSIPPALTKGCTPNCVYNLPLQLAIDPSGNHYVIGTQQLPFWDIDGKQVSPQGNIEGVEFVGSTVYLYRWAE